MNDSPSNFRKKVHIPFMDIDDLAFNRQDPKYVASITNLMQVPSSITLNNGNQKNQTIYDMPESSSQFNMDIPDKLTADDILTSKESQYSSSNSLSTSNQEFSNYNFKDANRATTPPSTPTKFIDEEIFTGKTPQIAQDLFNRMKPRRSSIEVDLHTEIRNLRDRVNNLEHECQVNSRSCKVFYTLLCGYGLIKVFKWLIGSN